MKNFLRYFFIDCPVNSVISLLYIIMMCVVLSRWKNDGDTLSYGLSGFFTFIFILNVIGEIVDYIKLKKSGK